MTRIRFEDSPSTNTPRNAANLNQLNNVVISSTEPNTGEELWIQKGKNLFNPNAFTFESGTISGTDGSNVADSSKIRLTQFLEVQPNTRYKFSNAENVACNRIIEYDENGDFVRYLAGTSTITTQSTTRKMRWVYGTTTTPTNIQVEAKASGDATAYEAYVDKKIYAKNAYDTYEEFYRDIETKILYSDANGTDGDIPINGNIKNYKYIEIRYVHGTGAYLNNQIIKVPADVLHFNLHSIFSGSYATYIRNNVYTISSNKITLDLTQCFQITNSSGTLSTSTSYLIKVLEVVGYK